jgi:hypothetical protein
VGIEVSPASVDRIIQESMVGPEFSLHLLPRPEVAPPNASSKPSSNAPSSYGKGADKPRQERDGPYRGKSKGKGKNKSKSPSVSMPLPLRGLNPRTRDNKPKRFDFNLGHGCANPHKMLQSYVPWLLLSTSRKSIVVFLFANILVGGLKHEFYVFPHIGHVIIPTDELIFFGGVAKSHQPYIYIICYNPII